MIYTLTLSVSIRSTIFHYLLLLKLYHICLYHICITLSNTISSNLIYFTLVTTRRTFSWLYLIYLFVVHNNTISFLLYYTSFTSHYSYIIRSIPPSFTSLSRSPSNRSRSGCVRYSVALLRPPLVGVKSGSTAPPWPYPRQNMFLKRFCLISIYHSKKHRKSENCHFAFFTI